MGLWARAVGDHHAATAALQQLHCNSWVATNADASAGVAGQCLPRREDWAGYGDVYGNSVCTQPLVQSHTVMQSHSSSATASLHCSSTHCNSCTATASTTGPGAAVASCIKGLGLHIAAVCFDKGLPLPWGVTLLQIALIACLPAFV